MKPNKLAAGDKFPKINVKTLNGEGPPQFLR